jgi:hypothetical protein
MENTCVHLKHSTTLQRHHVLANQTLFPLWERVQLNITFSFHHNCLIFYFRSNKTQSTDRRKLHQNRKPIISPSLGISVISKFLKKNKGSMTIVIRQENLL